MKETTAGVITEWTYIIEIEVVDRRIEDAWNTWYSDVHLSEFLEIPGMLRGDRYVAEIAGGERRYITIYQLADPAVIGSAEFEARRTWGGFAEGLRFRTGLFRRMVGRSPALAASRDEVTGR